MPETRAEPRHDAARQDTEELRAALELFARDWLFLLKSARVYPGGHPSLSRIQERLGAWRLPDGRAEVRLGVTPTELVLDNQFFGDPGSRVAELAKLLFSRNIRQFRQTLGADPDQLFLFATRLAAETGSDPRHLPERLAQAGVRDVGVEALDLDRFHDAFSTAEHTPRGDEGRRGDEAWLWFLSETSDPKDVARALSSDELWEFSEGSAEEAEKLAYALSGLGLRLEQGISALEHGKRSEVLKRLAALGRRIPPQTLREIIASTPEALFLQKEGMTALLGDLEGESLIDVMAGVMASEGASSPRFAALMQQITHGGTDEALNAVRKRLRDREHRGVALEIWKNLEELLLQIFDGQFVDDAYRKVLDDLAQARRGEVSYEVDIDFTQPADANLDLVFLSLAMAVGGLLADPWERLFRRARALAEERDVSGALRLMEAVDEVVPYALDTQADLLRDILLCASHTARDIDVPLRARMRRFADRHRRSLLEPLLDALKEANRISQRRLLVDVLSGLSHDTTPRLISRARSGPWYLTRNLVIVLGRRKDAAALPFLVTLTRNEDPRVAREALRALAHFGDRGRKELGEFRRNPDADPALHDLAQSLVDRMKPE